MKPMCKLIGENGNIFNLAGIARLTLIEAGMRSEADEMCDRIYASKSYNEALAIIADYVEVY